MKKKLLSAAITYALTPRPVEIPVYSVDDLVHTENNDWRGKGKRKMRKQK